PVDSSQRFASQRHARPTRIAGDAAADLRRDRTGAPCGRSVAGRFGSVDKMSAEITNPIGESLTVVLKRLDGAVDFWPLVCLAEVVSDRHAFVQTQIERLRGDLDVLTRQLGAEGLQPDLVEFWDTVCDALEVVFAVLTRFRDVSAAERQ